MLDFPFLPVGLLLLCSGIFSSSETAFFSLNKIQLTEIRDKFPRQYAWISHLLERPTSLVATLMIGNEMANVLLANILATFYNRQFDSWLTITVVNLCTALPLIIIFGEITPRVFAAKANVRASRYLAPLVWLLYWFSWPLRIIIELLVNSLSRLLGIKHQSMGKISEDDFLNVVEDSKSKGAIGESEQELIENVFELDDDKSSDIATPMKDYFTVQKDEFIHDLIPNILAEGFRRTPVVGDFPNEVVGVLYTKDLLTHAHREEEEIRVSHLMKDPVFVDPNMPVENLFKRLRQLRIHIAFVSSDERTVDGVVTMKTILEQIFGELAETAEEGDA